MGCAGSQASAKVHVTASKYAVDASSNSATSITSTSHGPGSSPPTQDGSAVGGVKQGGGGATPSRMKGGGGEIMDLAQVSFSQSV